MSKFTPGPWEVSIPKLAVYGQVNGFREVIAQCQNMPCVGGHDDLAAERGMDMEQANARLIAAAPEMYALLRRVADHFQDTDAPLGIDARAILARMGE